jgi:acetyl esterase/lipase
VSGVPGTDLILGGILLAVDGGATVNHLRGDPILGSQNSIAWRMNPNGNVDHASMTTHSISFLFRMNGVLQLPDTRRFFEVRDGTTVRWGLGITGKPLSPFEADSVAHRVTLIEGTSTERARSNALYGRLYENTWYQFQISVQPTAPKISIKVWAYGGGTSWSDVSAIMGFSYGPSGMNTTANRISFGIHPDNVSSFNSSVGWYCGDIQAWDTALADGGFGSGSTRYQVTREQVKQGAWNGTTETPGVTMSLWNGTAESSLTTALNWDYGQRYRPNEMAWSIASDAGNTLYGPDDDNQRYLVFKPPGSPPPGGWPYAIWVTTNYFTSGTYLGALTEHKDMLAHLLQMGVAVVSTGVRLANTEGTGWHFPQPILDAKLAARHVQANRTDLNHSKRFAMGHSSGGYISLAAQMSRNLTDNIAGAGGIDLTLNGNGYGGGAGSDPDYLGALVFSPVVDFQKTWEEDPTFPHTLGYGGARTAITAFMGIPKETNPPNFAGLNPADWIPLNLANQRPTMVYGSSGDSVVPIHNGVTLRDALVASGISATLVDIGRTTHPEVTAQWTPEWMAWLKALIA